MRRRPGLTQHQRAIDLQVRAAYCRLHREIERQSGWRGVSMTEPLEARSGAPIEGAIPVDVAPLESILRTGELHRRPSRPPGYEEENRALVTLVSTLADSPSTVFQTLAETILHITQCDSAGLSLLTADGQTPDVCGERFYWPAIAGTWKAHIGGGTPRNFGPCGDVLDRNSTLLFTHVERRYTYLLPIIPAVEECLLVPFYVAGNAVGTIWAIMHSDGRKFDAEDERVMRSLGKFASSAYQALESIDKLRFQVGEREKAEAALRDLADGLEMKVRARTRELERSTQELLATNEELEREIARRRHAEDRIRRSEALLAEAQRLSLTGTFSWRVATDEITWSEQLYRIYELEIGVPVTLELIQTRVHPEDVSLIEKIKMVDQAPADGNGFEWHYRLMTPDHSIKYLRVVAHTIRDQDGQLEYIAAVQDVTARRMSEEALSRARSELAKVARVTTLGVLTASIAHEINQPLSGIITNAGTCLRMVDANPPNLEGVRETARRTIRDGNRASDVITRLRALFGKEDLTLELLDLNEATREVIALSSSDLERNRVVLQPELTEDLPTITADRIQLQQVILNLLRNASDAMVNVHDRPRQLLIRTEREDGDRVRVSVRDAGVGIDPRSVNKLLDAFYTTKSDGMGIGLSISRSIIERHHGRLWAQGNDGPGATFSFSIPIVPDAAPR
jgi:signal transduction histidine kinase